MHAYIHAHTHTLRGGERERERDSHKSVDSDFLGHSSLRTRWLRTEWCCECCEQKIKAQGPMTIFRRCASSRSLRTKRPIHASGAASGRFRSLVLVRSLLTC